MSKVFIKRTTAPSKSDKNYYSGNVFYQCGYGMPNCTCYAFGRWQELLGKKPNLSTSNAENWYGKNDGYSRGKTPKLGAVICYRKGQAGNASDGAGHVAIVEEIYSDGSILISESNWGGTNFQTKKLDKNYTYGSLIFQGFIYIPIDFVEENKSSDKYKVGTTYKTQVILKVRSGAGTNSNQVPYEKLTANAKANAYSSGVNKGCLKEGTKVTCQEIKNIGKDIWIRIPSGWVAGYYSGKTYVK